MKKTFGILTVLTLTLLLVFSACEKENSLFNNQDDAEEEISLKSLEPDVVVKGTGNKADYEKIIVEEIVKAEQCDNEPVSGIIEFYYEDEMVFSVDFGNGDCDGQATVSWLDENNALQSKVVDVWSVFKKRNRHRWGKGCFELVYPVTFTMPDGNTEITLENKKDWDEIKQWFDENPSYQDEKPTLNYPVEIKYKDGTIATINNEQEMIEAKENCKGGGPNFCFELVFPVTFTMPDGSTEITLESKEDKIQIKEWFENNPDYEDEKPSLHFPVDIEYDDGTIVTINNEQEMHEAKENCK